jgi:tetratricopeptide (TPR) repeat protein
MTPSTVGIGNTVRVTTTIVESSTARRRVVRGSSNNGAVDLKFARRAIVATLPDHDNNNNNNNGNNNGHVVSLVQENTLVPEPLMDNNGERTKFLIAPMFDNNDNADDEVYEFEALISDLMPLLPFEKKYYGGTNIVGGVGTCDNNISTYKNCGDKLLRLNDYTCAITYYEAALNFNCVSTKFEVGGTVVVRQKGHCVIAEIDSIENITGNNSNTLSYDVTFTLSGDDATLSRKDLLLAIWPNDELYLQIKILLNLSRCLLKLADIDSYLSQTSTSTTTAKNNRHDKFRQAAVLGCSIAISICDHHHHHNQALLSQNTASVSASSNLISLIVKARIVRSRAFLGLRKIPNATMDVKKVLFIDSTNREAQRFVSEIDNVKAYIKSIDKKLSIEVCQWVQTVTDSSSNEQEATVSENENKNEDEAERSNLLPRTNDIDKWQRIARNISLMKVGTVLAFLLILFRLPTVLGLYCRSK